MKKTIVLLLSLASLVPAFAENRTEVSAITMEQLMRELRIQGGNFKFTFDEPVYAKVTVTTSDYPEGSKNTSEEFVTATAQRQIKLTFTVSPDQIGDYPRGDRALYMRDIKIVLSDCEATAGTRVISYADKFVENRFRTEAMVKSLQPDIPNVPQMDKEYIPHWYGRTGDPYEAKATIVFSRDGFKK